MHRTCLHPMQKFFRLLQKGALRIADPRLQVASLAMLRFLRNIVLPNIQLVTC